MTEPSMWTRLTEENPEHSAAYIQRFKDLAAAGQDLVGEARLVDAMLPRGSRVLDAGSGTGRIAAHLAAVGHDVVGVDGDPVLVGGGRGDAPGPRSSWATWPSSTCPLGASPSRSTRSSAPGNVVTFLGRAHRRGGAAPAAARTCATAAARRSASAPVAAMPSTTSSPTPPSAGWAPDLLLGHLGPAAVHARTPTSWSPSCGPPDAGSGGPQATGQPCGWGWDCVPVTAKSEPTCTITCSPSEVTMWAS